MSSNTQLAVVESPAPLAIRSEQMVDADRREVLKNAIMKGATDAQVELVVQICNRYGLDPLLKHLVLIDGNPYPTHKGLLHVAHESGEFDGIETVMGKDELGQYSETTIWRKDMSHPFRNRIYVKEYNKGRGAWLTNPSAMAAKTSESFVLRRAFNIPLTSAEEMDGRVPEQRPAPLSGQKSAPRRLPPPTLTEDPPPVKDSSPPKDSSPTPEQIERKELGSAISGLIAALPSVEVEKFKALLKKHHGTASLKGRTLNELREIHKSLLAVAQVQAEEDSPVPDAQQEGARNAPPEDVQEAILRAEAVEQTEDDPFGDDDFESRGKGER